MLIRMRLPVLACLALLVLAACQSPPKDPPRTVDSVDLERYMGLWYEIARLPVPFQDDEDLATAEYRLAQDGSVQLVNTAIRPDGRTESVTGSAQPVPGSNQAKLRVTIDNFFAKLFGSPPDWGNYWILRLAPDYSVALVGSPDREALWLLAREPEIPESTLEDYLQTARDRGYPTGEIIRHNGEFPETASRTSP